MRNIIPLFKRSNDAKHAGAKQILEECVDAIDRGDMGEKILVLSLKPQSGTLETVFMQSGMSAFDIIALLELAKMNIYNNYMLGGKK